jgi:ATP-dependent Clp protease ATP-binding subunit ClpX
LFIAGGAFDGLEKVIEQRQRGSSIGFVSNKEPASMSQHVTPEDFMKYGMIPEFMGRFPISVQLESLSLEDYTRVLIEPKNSLLEQMQFYFHADDIALTFEDAAILAIAQQAMELGIGARGLKTVLEHTMMPMMYSIHTMKKNGIKELSIGESMITNYTSISGTT